jgi:hypothetical protein
VAHGGEAALGGGELGLLQLDEGAHVAARVAVRQVEHRVVERVEAGQGDELELVAHRRQLVLEARDGGVVEVLLPVEGGRAVVGQQLARELRVDGFGELARELQVRLAGLAPHQVGVGRVGQAAADRLLDARLRLVEAFDRALAGDEGLVVGVDVGGEQVGGLGVGARDQQRRHAEHVGGQARGDELLHASCVGTSTLPPMWPHFFTLASWSSKCTPAAPASIIASSARRR